MKPHKPSYGELEKRVAELQEELNDIRSGIERRNDSHLLTEDPNQTHLDDLAFLSATASEFFDLPPHRNIYQVIGSRLKEIAGNAIVIVSSYHKQTNLLRTEFIKGLGRYAEPIIQLLNKNPVGMTVAVDNSDALRVLLTGKMEMGPEGIYELCFGAIPRAICRTIEKMVGIGPIYVIGFVNRGALLGDMVIISRRGTNQTMVAARRQLIETFTHQAAVALQRKQFEDALSRSEKKYRQLFENGLDLICIHDLDGNLLETNLQYKKKYGWQREELDGLNLVELMPDHHRPQFDEYMKRILGNRVDEGYLKILTKSGATAVIEYRNRLILDDHGEPIAVQGAARDVTKRVTYNKALKESEAKYKELVQYAPAGIYEFNMETLQFTSVNDVMCTYTGYSQSEFLNLDPFAILSDESKGALTKLVQDVFTNHPQELSTEYKIKGKNQREFWVLAKARFFYDNGQPKRAMVVVHDMTDIRRAEEERRKLEIQLQNAQKLESLGTLAGRVAHDLNNILSGIVSYPDLLLLDIEDGSPLHEPLLAIKGSGEKAAEIVQDLLTLARRSVARKKIVNLNQIVKKFIASPEHLRIFDGRSDLTLEMDITDDLLNIAGSGLHLSKTVMNLMTNAADAMPAGGKLTVATRNCYIDQPHMGFEIIPQGEYAVIEVSDQGIGMPSSDVNKIFEPFYTKKVLGRSGTGLGMSVVWGTVKDHGGFIDIITEEGYGTTFVLYLPASRTEVEVAPSVFIDDYLGRGESVLIVDDAQEQRNLAKRMMQRLGYEVTTVASGEEALAMIKQKPFDVLVLDMIMPPGLDGLDTYQQILNVAPDQKAVIASGYAETDRVKKAQQIGAGRYIKKPFTLEKIGLAVRDELDRLQIGNT